jgi:hypothetical protein
MTIKKVIVTNILETKSAFGVLEEDHKQNVFIPSKTFINCNADIGDTVSALVVPNMQYPDKTPWLASRIITNPVTEVHPLRPSRTDLRKKVINYLQEYDATFEEILNHVGGHKDDINDALTSLLQDGMLLSEVVYIMRYE